MTKLNITVSGVLFSCLALAHAGGSSGEQIEAVDPRLGAPFMRRERPQLGSDQAPIIVVEVASYICNHCQQFHERVFPSLRQTYINTGKVQWFLIPATAESEEYGYVFLAGRCLNRQGKLWELIGFLMTQGHRSSSVLENALVDLPGIDGSELRACRRDFTVRQLVAGDFAELRQLRIKGTPTFILRKARPDGTFLETRLEGYQSLEYFQRVLDDLLAKQ